MNRATTRLRRVERLQSIDEGKMNLLRGDVIRVNEQLNDLNRGMNEVLEEIRCCKADVPESINCRQQLAERMRLLQSNAQTIRTQIESVEKERQAIVDQLRDLHSKVRSWEILRTTLTTARDENVARIESVSADEQFLQNQQKGQAR